MAHTRQLVRWRSRHSTEAISFCNLHFHWADVIAISASALQQIECGLTLSVLLSTTMCVIMVVKMLWTQQNKSIDKKIDNAKPHSICFLPQYQCLRICFFFQSASWKRHCVTHWSEQRRLDSYRQRQISQSDCEISSNCAKIFFYDNCTNSRALID